MAGTQFCTRADLRRFARRGELLVVRFFNPYDPTIPRVKQSWTEETFSLMSELRHRFSLKTTGSNLNGS
jgi:hypothetical protein